MISTYLKFANTGASLSFSCWLSSTKFFESIKSCFAISYQNHIVWLTHIMVLEMTLVILLIPSVWLRSNYTRNKLKGKNSNHYLWLGNQSNFGLKSLFSDMFSGIFFFKLANPESKVITNAYKNFQKFIPKNAVVRAQSRYNKYISIFSDISFRT